MNLEHLAHASHRPETVSDLGTIATPPRRLAVFGDTGNMERLSEWPDLEEIWIHNASPKQFAGIAPLINPKLLSLYGVRVTGLEFLAEYGRLTAFALDWNTKVQSLEPLSGFTQLEFLSLEDVPKVRDLAPLSALTNLEGLQVSGGMWKVFKADSLEPLSALTGLQELQMVNVQVADNSLQPLSQLKSLRKLILSNQFPTEEYARLSVLLPHCACDMFRPYSELSDMGKVMITGKRKPFLDPQSDQAKIETYVVQWQALQDRFRKDAAS